ncbi:MAG: extracellular solute-binding protein [Lachnospiraceae bacterium]|jgi:ABC-type glycerol-3-phosphate transport system substrate-binding protein|nr:extracellular solute-binding protein [Lachnospiraceae bacterium]
MNIQNTCKRLLAIFMCLCLVIPVAGCGDGRDAGENGKNTGGSDFVYTPEYKTLDGISFMKILAIDGGKLYYRDWRAGSDGENQSSLMSLDLDTLEKTPLPIALSPEEEIQCLAPGQDGTLWALTSVWDETLARQSFFLAGFDDNGAESFRQDLTSLIAGEESQDVMTSFPQYMAVGRDGNICILINGMEEKLLVLDNQGKQLFELSDSSWTLGLCTGPDGQVYRMVYDSDGSGNSCMLQQIDMAQRSYGTGYKGVPGGSGDVLLRADADNGFLISNGNSLYHYDMEKQSAEPLLNWLDCDIDASQMQAFVRTADGRILAIVSRYDYEQDKGQAEAVYLSRIPASEAVQKTVLTYATMFLDYDLRTKIIQFNKTNPNWRIQVKEYGNEDYQTGLSQLNADIISGNPPDLIDLGDSGIYVDNFIAKGILTDLTPFLEQDGTLNREDLIENVVSVYERDGKLYGIAPSFGISTLVGKAADLGQRDGWTIQDVKELMASRPAGTELLESASKEYLLSLLLSGGLDGFVDPEKGECSFDSAEFSELLEFVNQFPSQETVETGERTANIQEKLSEGRLLLSSMSMHSVQDYQYQQFLYNEPITCIGYPTADGAQGSRLRPSQGIGISEKSQQKEGAWAFISMLLSEENQESISFGFPIRSEALEKVLARSMEENEMMSAVIFSDGGSMYASRPATQEQVDAVRKIILSSRGSIHADSEIMDIISEEAASYFAGQKSVSEVVDIIQSRVQLYISENS